MKSFPTLKAYERYLRKTNNSLDNVKIGQIIYTMDNYDSDGRDINYGNKRTGKSFFITTSNRYGLGKFSDAKIERSDEGYSRNDISYVD